MKSRRIIASNAGAKSSQSGDIDEETRRADVKWGDGALLLHEDGMWMWSSIFGGVHPPSG